jgi:hypothetical protein
MTRRVKAFGFEGEAKRAICRVKSTQCCILQLWVGRIGLQLFAQTIVPSWPQPEQVVVDWAVVSCG